MKLAIALCITLALATSAHAGAINFNSKTEDFCQALPTWSGWVKELSDAQKAIVIDNALSPVGGLWSELNIWLNENNLGNCDILKSTTTKVCIDAPFGSETDTAIQVRLELDCWGTQYRAWYEYPRDCTFCSKKK